jgi:pimeloyl-ACP methyl ester carboxylesterase
MLHDASRAVHLEVLVEGEGDDVVLVPSSMRGARDFAHLQSALAEAGYRSIAVNLRGAGGSSPPEPDVTLRDLADDIAFVIRSLGQDRAHLVGHALGNIVVRATASYVPDVARTVTVMPCGGHNLGTYPVPERVSAAFARCLDANLPEEDRLEALGVAFFAPGNDARSWLEGWFPASSLGGAIQADPEEWWRAGSAPMLIIQPISDAMVPVAVGRDAAAELGSRATYVEVQNCGHAVLPEQPGEIAAHIIRFLGSQAPATPG